MSEQPDVPAENTPEDHHRELAELREAERVLVQRDKAFVESLLSGWDTDDWKVIYDQGQPGLSEIAYDFTLAELTKWRNKSREMYFSGSSHVRRAVNNCKNYVIGQGMRFSAAVDKDNGGRDRGEEIDAYFEAWSKRNDWGNRQREIVERGQLSGEVYLRFLRRDGDLKPSFINPEDIRDPAPNTDWPLGVKFANGFVEDVVAYAWTTDPNATKEKEWIPAAEVVRWFFLGSPSTVRGFPPMIPALNRIRQYEGWIRDRILLNKVRARVAVVKSYIGASPAQITAAANAATAGTTIDPKTGEAIRHEQIKPGSIVHSSANTKWEYLTPNVQAADVHHDGRQILLDFCAAVGQPEFAITMDASNSNYASTMVAEAPGIKEWESQQGICMIGFENVWQRVITYGVMEGAIKQAPRADFENNVSGYEVMIQPPKLVSRDRLDDTKADEILVTQDAMSRTTMMQRAELDPDVEREQMTLERGEEAGYPAHNGTETEGREDGDDEDEDGQTA